MTKHLSTLLGLSLLLALGCAGEGPTTADVPTTTAGAEEAATEAADEATSDIVDVAAGNEDFSTLVGLVEAAGLVDTLKSPGPFTVFAPTNAAFAAVPQETMDALGADVELLRAVLTYHVIAGQAVMASTAVTLEGADVETANGATVNINATTGTVVLTGGQGSSANVVATDVVASNGVIHVIDSVILPPAAE
ncbi:MAG: fasciclin domain-containing protein [Myxococcota bacterium]